MTDERRRNLDAVRAYVALLQPLFRLQHYEIEVWDEPPENKDAFADCGTKSRQHWARLRFAEKHFDTSPDEQRNTVAHELLHVLHDGVDVAAIEGFGGLATTSEEWARQRYDHENERLIDALSRVLAPLLPLPPAPKEG